MNLSPRNTILFSILGLALIGAYIKVNHNPVILPTDATGAGINSLTDELNQHQQANTIPAKLVEQFETKQQLEILTDDEQALDEAQKQALLEHPAVQAYFDKEQDKAALDAYFNEDDPSTAYSDQEIWQIIERIEDHGRVFAFEAMTLKLRWLEKNSDNELDFKQRSEALIAEYRERARIAQENYDPNTIPGFSEYKQEEARIIREANEMQVYPEGMSKQEYLRQALLEARKKAYKS